MDPSGAGSPESAFALGIRRSAPQLDVDFSSDSESAEGSESESVKRASERAALHQTLTRPRRRMPQQKQKKNQQMVFLLSSAAGDAAEPESFTWHEAELLKCGGLFRVANDDPWCVARAACTAALYFAHTDLANGSPTNRAYGNGQVKVSTKLIDATLPSAPRWDSRVAQLLKGLTDEGAAPEDSATFEAQSHERFAFQRLPDPDGAFGLVHKSPRLLDPLKRSRVTHVLSFGFRDGHCVVGAMWLAASMRATDAAAGGAKRVHCV